MNLAHLLASLSQLYEVERDVTGKYGGAIIALPIPADVAQKVAVEGGESPHDLHVTLAFLGRTDTLSGSDLMALAEGLHLLAQHLAPLTGKFGGPGRFLNLPGGQDACYLSFDCPALPAFREMCVRLAGVANLPPDTTHGFTPHVTVQYVAASEPHPAERVDQTPFAIPTVELWLGGNRVKFPLAGQPVTAPLTLAKADMPSPQGAGEARTLLAQLGGDLRRIEAEDSALKRRADALHQGHAARFAELAGSIPASRGSALEEAAMGHARDAAIAARVAQR